LTVLQAKALKDRSKLYLQNSSSDSLETGRVNITVKSNGGMLLAALNEGITMESHPIAIVSLQRQDSA